MTEWAYAPKPWFAGSLQLAALLDSSLDLLEQLDVRVPPNGRHRVALRRLRESNMLADQSQTMPTELMGKVQHAHRTAWETAMIAVAAFRAISQLRGRARSSQPFTMTQLQMMMKGPEEYVHHSDPGWNAQFELFVASQLVLGGLAVRSGEPDLRFQYGHEWTGVACKRVSSPSHHQLKKNLTDAANQIQRSGRRGWIALNLESAFRDISTTGRRRSLVRQFTKAFESLDPIASQISSRPDVLGVIGYAYLSSWQHRNGRKPMLRISAPFRWLCWEGDHPEAKLFFLDFQRAWRPRVRAAISAIMNGDITQVL